MKRRVNAAAAGAATSLVGVAGVSAQSRLLDLQGKFLGGGDAGTGDIASSGNGGVATSSANGGAVSIADINSGGNAGNAIGVAGVSSAQAQSILGLRDKFFGGGEEFVDTASAGNGGVATASANGGAVSIADINSGGNAGNAIGVGDTSGSVAVDGGTVGNLTDLNITANGGTAIADASGGDYNLAFVS